MTHAIVIGASIAGLVAARALAGHFGQVTVLERDTLPEQALPRRGVPQGQHAHGLLAAGLHSLEALFPGFTQDMVQAGAHLGDAAENMLWHQFGAARARSHSGISVLATSRPLLETVVYKRVKALPNVRFETNCAVQNLLLSADGGRVNGVLVRGGDDVVLPRAADLVVDASGRGSQAPLWLNRLGYPTPRQTEIEINVGYTTRTYRTPPGLMGQDIIKVIVPTAPKQKRAGVLIAAEGERLILTVVGSLGNHAPTEEERFLEAVRTLPAPDIYEVIRHAEPLTAAVQYRFPHNQRRHYEHLKYFPIGFLVMGDALCSFNPVYGQGMTVAALEAVALQEELKAGLDSLGGRFFRRAARIIDTPWTIAVGEDLRYPQVQAPRPPSVRLTNWYVAQVLRASHRDPLVCNAFHRVANLLQPPSSLFKPEVVLRVLSARLGFAPSPVAKGSATQSSSSSLQGVHHE